MEDSLDGEDSNLQIPSVLVNNLELHCPSTQNGHWRSQGVAQGARAPPFTLVGVYTEWQG